MMFVYHSTHMGTPQNKSPRSAYQLLKAVQTHQKLFARSTHVIGDQVVDGLCTTRSKILAFNGRVFGDIVFELHLDKLKYRNKVVPIDGNISFERLKDGCDNFPTTSDDRYHHLLNTQRDRIVIDPPVNMAEEFVIGDIKKFRDCINHIYILEPMLVLSDELQLTYDRFEVLVNTMRIPYSIETNPGDIQLIDVYRTHHQHRKVA